MGGRSKRARAQGIPNSRTLNFQEPQELEMGGMGGMGRMGGMRRMGGMGGMGQMV
jgi:hypothetical protein